MINSLSKILQSFKAAFTLLCLRQKTPSPFRSFNPFAIFAIYGLANVGRKGRRGEHCLTCEDTPTTLSVAKALTQEKHTKNKCWIATG